jgi:dipeptidyl aminopeptidase/acylaminoacyl peptidase
MQRLQRVSGSLPIRAAAQVAAAAILAACLAACSAKSAASSGDVTPAFVPPPVSSGPALQPTDLYHLDVVSSVAISPDGNRVAYAVTHHDSPQRTKSSLMVLELPSGQPAPVGPANSSGSAPHWSPDGKSIAYEGSANGQSGLWVAQADGSGATYLGPMEGTDGPVPGAGNAISWSPDNKQIAFVSSTPGPETAAADGDPHVFTRYLYKPSAGEGVHPFQDNRRLHVFIADIASKQVRQVTSGDRYEHSVEWAPSGDRILFESNMEENPDQNFNYDILTVGVSDGAIHQLTHQVGPKYGAVWSPDGSKIAYTHTVRPITSMETTAEDDHLYIMNADGSNAHLVTGQADLRYGTPQWSADGSQLYFTLQDHGQVKLEREAAAGGPPQVVVGGEGSLGYSGWSLAKTGAVAYAYSTPTSPPQLYVASGNGSPQQLTHLDQDVLSAKQIAPVERLEFKSRDGLSVEAFLTRPPNLGATPAAHSVPLVVNAHGGPHGEQGPEFNSTNQIYAGHGFATLMVNYRGSTGYGQAFEDKILNDQDGGEMRDVLDAVDAALAKYSWLDPNRLGVEGTSYGGQVADFIPTMTTRFKASIPTAGVSNLVTENYVSYYHDYLPAEYKGGFNSPERKDILWDHSAIRFANKVTTPMLIIHGANDNDVPWPEAEEYYIALKDAGDQVELVLYPGEGHGIRGTAHQVDKLNRSMQWYDKYFAAATQTASTQR